MTEDNGAVIPAGSTTTDVHPNISGTGTAGDIIKVYDGSIEIGSVKIGTDGKWTIKTPDLSKGSHGLYVTETTPAGKHNTLKLSLVDVLNLGETDLFQHDGKQQMMVNGKEGDEVDLSNSHIAGLAEGEWQQHGTTQVGGVTYNVYEHSSAQTELLIEHSVRIEML
jgi:hypothetical protein